MKYNKNNIKFNFNYEKQQEIICENQIEIKHKDIIDPSLDWYKDGFCAVSLDQDMLISIRKGTREYLRSKIQKATGKELNDLEKYHELIVEKEDHLCVLAQLGKLIKPEDLNIDLNYLTNLIKQVCNISKEITCQNVCDIRMVRPYTGKEMDNNPLHRDTWLPILNNCLNVFIPIMGTNELSSLPVLPGSHLWGHKNIYRTKENAYSNNLQYGLPGITAIKRDYEIIRPKLKDNEVLVFSSNIIHGAAINLNKNITRASIEIRFWIKESLKNERP